MLAIKYYKIKLSVIIYSSFPLFIFFFGWLRLPYSIMFSIFLSISIVFYYLQIKKNDEFFEIKKSTLHIVVLLIILFTIFTGVGGFFAQNIDFSWRTAIFRDLVQYDWPVYYPKTDSALHYYFLYWLPAATIGKLTNFAIAQVTLFLYFSLGILFIYLVIAKNTNSKLGSSIVIIITIFSFGILEFFSGTIFSFVFENFNFSYRFIFTEQWLQFVNNQISMSFIYNQTIIPWLMLLLITTDKKIFSFALCGGLAAVFSPFSVFCLGFYTVGFLIYDFYMRNKTNKTTLLKYVKQVFNPCNIFAAITILPVFGLYYLESSKASGGSSNSLFSWSYAGADMTTFIYVIVFYLLAISIFAIALYKFEKKNIFYYITFLLMVILPHIRITSSGLTDFIAHASPIVTFYIMYMCLKNITDNKSVFSHKFSYILVCVALSLSTLNYQAEMWYSLNDIFTNKCINPVSEKIYTLSDKVDEVNFFIHDPNLNRFNILFGKKYE